MAEKKIIYLFGSGATHAVINSIDPTKQLLTADIRQKIGEREQQLKGIEIKTEIWNELMDPAVDIEHLISILETNHHYSSSQKIRGLYHQAIVDLSNEAITKIHERINTPNLYSILFDLHNVKDLQEKVIGVFTLNYENFLEQTLKKHLGISVNYLVGKKSKRNTNREIPVLKLHGSFNWKNTTPVSFGEMDKIREADALWIPPGVDKKKESYPFNFLWGKAFEFLLDCNILRVIGCSLSRNDWGLIPMIYTAMRLSGNNPKFEVEIIDFLDKGSKIQTDYPYLNIKTIIEIKEFKKYLDDSYRLPKSSSVPDYVRDDISSDASKRVNIFALWLKAKRFDLQRAGKNVRTAKQYFPDFN